MLVKTDLRAGTGSKRCGGCGALIVFNPQLNVWINVNTGIQDVDNNQENES